MSISQWNVKENILGQWNVGIIEKCWYNFGTKTKMDQKIDFKRILEYNINQKLSRGVFLSTNLCLLLKKLSKFAKKGWSLAGLTPKTTIKSTVSQKTWD